MFDKFKASGALEFGQLPILTLRSKGQTVNLSQSIAILRYCGIKYGYYPNLKSKAIDAWKIDSIVDSYSDTIGQYYKANFADGENRSSLLQSYFDHGLPKWQEAMQKRLIANTSKKFIVGDKMTIADFVLASWAYSTYLNPECTTIAEHTEVVAKFPELDTYYKRLGEELKTHLETRIKSSW